MDLIDVFGIEFNNNSEKVDQISFLKLGRRKIRVKIAGFPLFTMGRDPLISQKCHTKKVALLWILHVHSVVGSQMELVQGCICFRSHSLHLLMSSEVSEKFELQ